MIKTHYTDYNSFTEAFAGFMQIVRNSGFQSGIQSSKETLTTALSGLWLDRDIFHYALTSIFCTSEEETKAFKTIYKRFWRIKTTHISDKRTHKNKKTVKKNDKSIAVMMGIGDTDMAEAKEEAKNTSGANLAETIKSTDFSKLSVMQNQMLDELSEKLLREMSLRLKRKKKKAIKGSVDIAHSIRKNIQKGGNIIDLVRKDRKKDKYRLVILLDVSGSMDKYSFYLLKFIWTLRSHFAQIEAFAFSTKLMRITDYLSDKNMAVSLSLIFRNVTHWSSGTQIGRCLEDFNEQFAKRYLNGKTMTIILSDGLDTGEPEILEQAIKKIKMKSKRLIWLNPLKGMQGYEPIQRGMAAALPTVDTFHSAHNLNSLLELENILSNV